MSAKECPLLKRYNVDPRETAENEPLMDWVKELCWKYCPLNCCMYDYKGSIKEVDYKLLAKVEVVKVSKLSILLGTYETTLVTTGTRNK